MFSEAMSAIQAGDRTRARDLLTRLLKNEQNNPEYWVWMSAVVDTSKERAFCLKEALRLDPENPAAQRGLSMLGLLPVDASRVVPLHYQKRGWQSKLGQGEGAEALASPSRVRFALMGAALLVVVGLILFAVFAKLKPDPVRTTEVARKPSATAMVTNTSAVQLKTAGPTVTGPVPLWMRLEATYTPTPLYVNTLHPITEDYRIGIRNYERGDWEAAQTHFNNALRLEQGAVDILYHLGEAHRMQGDYAAALATFNQVVEKAPGFAPGYLARALTLLANENVSNSDRQKARADLELAVEKDPALAQAYLELVALLLESDEYEEALVWLEKAEAIIPDSALLYLHRGMVDMQHGDAEQALENAHRALELDLTLLPAYRLLGQALQATGDLQGSLEPLVTYTQFEKDDALAWSLLAAAQQAEGDTAAALNSLENALRLNSNSFEARMARANICLEAEDGHGALTDFQAAWNINKQSFEASMGVGKALMLLEYEGDAYMQFERSQNLAKEEEQKAEWMYWRALSLDALDERVAALRAWRSLLDLPETVMPASWRTYAHERVEALITATPTPRPTTATPKVTSTHTRQPTLTFTPTRTPKPSQTPAPSATRKP